MNKTRDRLAGLSAAEKRALLADLVRKKAARPSIFPASFAQQRLWFLDQLEPNSPFYNIAAGVRLVGRLDAGLLERGLGEIVRRHEALRTTFAAGPEGPVQVVAPTLELPLEIINLSSLPKSERETETRRRAGVEARRPFDLARGPLVRSVLLVLSESENVFLLTLHHSVGDGWSMGVLIRELAALYAAFRAGRSSPLPELPVQYADYAVWQRNWLQGENLHKQLAYWKQRWPAWPRWNCLPTGRAAVGPRYEGAHFSFEISHDLAEAVRTLSRRQGVTLFMTLLAAFQVLLHRHTGQDDIAVGSPIAGRNRKEIEGLIGFFVNTLVLRPTCPAIPPSANSWPGCARRAWGPTPIPISPSRSWSRNCILSAA